MRRIPPYILTFVVLAIVGRNETASTRWYIVNLTRAHSDILISAEWRNSRHSVPRLVEAGGVKTAGYTPNNMTPQGWQHRVYKRNPSYDCSSFFSHCEERSNLKS